MREPAQPGQRHIDAAAYLYALLHNGREPYVPWEGETRRYYEHVITLLVAHPAVAALAAGHRDSEVD